MLLPKVSVTGGLHHSVVFLSFLRVSSSLQSTENKCRSDQWDCEVAQTFHSVCVMAIRGRNDLRHVELARRHVGNDSVIFFHQMLDSEGWSFSHRCWFIYVGLGWCWFTFLDKDSRLAQKKCERDHCGMAARVGVPFQSWRSGTERQVSSFPCVYT